MKKKGAVSCPLFRFPICGSIESVSAYGQGPPAMRPLPLLKVQETPLQLLWVAVNKKVLVPAAEVTVTPVVGLKPGAVEPVKALDDTL